MNEQDLKEIELMDILWLQTNGWTVAGNLAYRRILREAYKDGVPPIERIQQILMTYELPGEQMDKIYEELCQLNELRARILSQFEKN